MGIPSCGAVIQMKVLQLCIVLLIRIGTLALQPSHSISFLMCQRSPALFFEFRLHVAIHHKGAPALCWPIDLLGLYALYLLRILPILLNCISYIPVQLKQADAQG